MACGGFEVAGFDEGVGDAEADVAQAVAPGLDCWLVAFRFGVGEVGADF